MEKRKIGCDSRLGGTENRRANFRYHRPCSGCRIQRYRHRTIRNRPVRTRFGEITAGPQILVDGGCNNYARGGQLESDQFRQRTTRQFLAGAFSGELVIRRRRGRLRSPDGWSSEKSNPTRHSPVRLDDELHALALSRIDDRNGHIFQCVAARYHAI